LRRICGILQHKFAFHGYSRGLFDIRTATIARYWRAAASSLLAHE
jgi:hypothetical protein